MGYKLLPPGSRRNNACYVVRGTVGGSRFEERTGETTRAAADEWALRYIAALKPPGGGAAAAPVTFEQAALAYIDFKSPRRDDLRFIQKLIRYFPDRTAGELVGADLIGAANALLPRAGNAHKNRSIITNASAILHYAQEQGWAPERRFRRFAVSRKSQRRPAPPEVMRILLANTTGIEHLFLAFLYEAGPRITDLLRLHEEDCHLQRAVARLGSSKTDDAGEIGLSPELVAMLANRLAEPYRRRGRVFPWGDRHNVYRWLKPLCARLEVAYTPHLSRHAMATDMIAMGMDRKAVAERGLWRDQRSVDRYDHHRSAAVPDRGVGDLLGQKRGKG